MPKKKKTSSDLQKEEIYQFYAQKIERPLTLNDLLNAFDIYDEADKLFVQLMIEELHEKGRLKSVGRNRYIATTPTTQAPQTVIGKVDFVNPRFAFIRHAEGEPDIFVEVDDLNEAWNGDTVEVKILPTTRKKGNNPEGRVLRIVERAQQRIVGKVKIFGSYGLFKSDNRSFHQEIFISKANLAQAAPDDIVVVEVLSYPQGPKQATGKIVDILGKVGENNAEMNAIMAEFGLPVQFPDGVEEEAEKISTLISEEEIARRRDFRSVLTFTIDPVDAKDFDDGNCHYKIEFSEFLNSTGVLSYISSNRDRVAIHAFNDYLTSVCDIENFSNRSIANKIQMTSSGTVNLGNDLWFVDNNNKVKIRFT